jgi:hypothetical protein
MSILPILFTLRSVLPFLMVISFLLLGFISSLLALQGEGFSIQAFHNSYLLGFMGEMSTFSKDNTGPMQFWVFLFSLVVTVLMFNLLVGILSESYELCLNKADVIFNRERARMIVTTRLSMLKASEVPNWCHRCSSCTFLCSWLYKLLVFDDPTGHFLFASFPAAAAENGTRLGAYKDFTKRHIEQQLNKFASELPCMIKQALDEHGAAAPAGTRVEQSADQSEQNQTNLQQTQQDSPGTSGQVDDRNEESKDSARESEPADEETSLLHCSQNVNI